MEDELIVFCIAQRGTDRLAVTIAAATEMTFEIVLTAGIDYSALIADLCAIAPVMQRYDSDLAEGYDNAFRTQPNKQDGRLIRLFLMKYRTRIKNASVGIEGFPEGED